MKCAKCSAYVKRATYCVVTKLEGRMPDDECALTLLLHFDPWEAEHERRVSSRALELIFEEVATATENPTIPVRIRQNHLTNSPNGAMNGDA